MDNSTIKGLKIVQQVGVTTLFNFAKAAEFSIAGGSTTVLLDVEQTWETLLSKYGVSSHNWFDQIIGAAHEQGIGLIELSYAPIRDYPVVIDDFFGDRKIMEFGVIKEPISKEKIAEAAQKGLWVSALIRVPAVTDKKQFAAIVVLRGIKPAAIDALALGEPFSQFFITPIGFDKGDVILYALGQPMPVR